VLQHTVGIIIKLLIGKNFENEHCVIYNAIHRYENTIAGQFFGHVHAEGKTIFFDETDKTRPVSVVHMPFLF